MYLHVLLFLIVYEQLTYPGKCLVTHMYTYYMYCVLTRTHEDMLCYRRECVTHWEIQVFR